MKLSLTSSNHVWSGKSGLLRAVIVDPQPLWQEAFASMLAAAGITTVGTAASLAEAEQLVAEQAPQILIVAAEHDRPLPPELGDIAAQVPWLRCIVALDCGHDGCLDRLATAGVDACVAKTEPLAAIGESIDEVLRQFRTIALSRREAQVLGLVAQGWSNRDIAVKLWLSEETIKFHVARTYRKLGVRRRAAAAELARCEGLVVAGDGADDDGATADGGGAALADVVQRGRMGALGGLSAQQAQQ